MKGPVLRTVLAFGLVAMACGGGSSTEPSPAVKAAAGTYQLKTVKGSPLPVPLFGQCSLGAPQPCAVCTENATSGTVTLTAGSNKTDNHLEVSLVASGLCTDPLNRSATSPTSYTIKSEGSWSESGGTITFTSATNVPMGLSTATLSGSTLSMSLNWISPDPGGQSVPVTATFSR